MDVLLQPARFSIDPNTPDADLHWNHWLRTFQNFLLSPQVQEQCPNKLHLLINFVSHNVYEHISKCMTFDSAIDHLHKLYKKPDELFYRNKLINRRQLPGQSLDVFLAALKFWAKSCDFKAVTAEKNRDDFIRDVFISGISSKKIRSRLLKEQSLELAQVFELAKSIEEKEKLTESSSSINGVSQDPPELGTMPPKGRKRKSEEAAAGDEAAPAETKPKLKTAVSVTESLSGVDFNCSAKSPDGKEANFKIASWNINGIRAWLGKEGLSYLKAEQPDVLCVQELKCDISKIPEEAQLEGYTTHWLSGDTEGYSGVGIYFKNKPLKITEGIGIEKHDNEGRCITAEFEKFYLVNTYIPNSGRGLPRLAYRTKEWDIDFRAYLKTLDAKKPVVWCGDLNVAHQEIDIKNAKPNKKNAGFTQEERDSFTETLGEGFIDSFRHLHPDEVKYSFWAYFMNARAKNAGWRLDYFVLSERFKDSLCESEIRTSVMGSDHCPVILHLAL